MANLQTTYMGLPLKNPIIAGASDLTAHRESLLQLEAAGAGAVVLKSLFEEQIQVNRVNLKKRTTPDAGQQTDVAALYAKMAQAGPEEHLRWVKQAKVSVTIPVIASLNLVTRKSWLKYASLFQDAGVDGLELNFYAVPRESGKSGAAIEQEQIAVARKIVETLSIPVSVKLSPFYTNPLNMLARFAQVGVKGFVLFNRVFQPDIDVDAEHFISPFNLSRAIDNRLPLRFAGLAYHHLPGDICSNTGIFEAADVIKMLLAGAQCVQVVSVLYKKNIAYLRNLIEGLDIWMERRGYGTIADFRGKLSKPQSREPWVYERTQYVRLLFEADELLTEDLF